MTTTPEIDRLRAELAAHKALRPSDPHSKTFAAWLDRKDALATALQRAVYAEQSAWHPCDQERRIARKAKREAKAEAA